MVRKRKIFKNWPNYLWVTRETHNHYMWYALDKFRPSVISRKQEMRSKPYILGLPCVISSTEIVFSKIKLVTFKYKDHAPDRHIGQIPL